jgi:hypothetical protein
MQLRTQVTWWLVGGDILAVLVLSIIGYLMHYAGKEPFSFRWLSTFLPFCLGWGMAASLAGLYSAPVASHWRESVWRAALAGILAAPFAAMVRGLYLDAAVSPLFMIVLSAFAMATMALWRGIWAMLASRKNFYG